MTIAEQIQAKAAEVAAFLETLQPAGTIEARYLASAKRDIAGGFIWAERVVSGSARD